MRLLDQSLNDSLRDFDVQVDEYGQDAMTMDHLMDEDMALFFHKNEECLGLELGNTAPISRDFVVEEEGYLSEDDRFSERVATMARRFDLSEEEKEKLFEILTTFKKSAKKIEDALNRKVTFQEIYEAFQVKKVWKELQSQGVFKHGIFFNLHLGWESAITLACSLNSIYDPAEFELMAMECFESWKRHMSYRVDFQRFFVNWVRQMDECPCF